MKKLLSQFTALVLFLSFQSITVAQNFQWANGIGGMDTDIGYGVAVDDTGNVYFTGYFQGTADFDPSANTAFLNSPGVSSAYLAKYDADGNYLWAIKMGGMSSVNGKSVTIDGNGHIYVCGSFGGTADFDPSANTANLVSAGSNDMFLAKYNASGQYIWAIGLGGIGLDNAEAVVVDGENNVLITGYFSDSVDFDPSTSTTVLVSAGIYDMFIAKYNASGGFIWAISMEGEDFDMANDLKVDSMGNVFVTGFFKQAVDFDPSAATAVLSSAGGFDSFVAKYSSSGSFLWAKRIGGMNDISGNGLAVDNNGNVCVVGRFQGTAGFDFPSGTASLTSQGSNDVFMAKYDALGDYLWAKSMGGTGSCHGNGIALDASNNIYITGFFLGMADFDPSATNTQNLLSNGLVDVFIAKYDVSGNYIWARNVGGVAADFSYNIALDHIGNVHITGFFQQSADFNPSLTNSAILNSAGGNDIFIAKYSGSSMGVNMDMKVPKFSLFPNPTNDFLLLTDLPFVPSSIQIYNQNGQLIQHLKSIEERIDVAFLPTGLYVLVITDPFGQESSATFVKK